jgi:hypothetical protein
VQERLRRERCPVALVAVITTAQVPDVNVVCALTRPSTAIASASA